MQSWDSIRFYSFQKEIKRKQKGKAIISLKRMLFRFLLFFLFDKEY